MRIFIGAAKPGDLNVLGVTLELWKIIETPSIGLASIGGSSIITAMLAMKIPFEKRFRASLKLLSLCQGYGWNELSVSKLLDIRLPNNIYTIEPLLFDLFGDKTFEETLVPLEVIVYNLTRSRFEIFSTSNTPKMIIRKALIIALSMPGYYNRTFFQGDEYIDASVIDRYPVRLFNNPTKGIYIQSESVSYLDIVLNAINRPIYIQPNDVVVVPEYSDGDDNVERFNNVAKAYLSVENKINLSL